MVFARGCQAFHEFTPTRAFAAERGRIYRKIGYGPLLDVFMLDMRSYRGPNSDGRQVTYGPAAHFLGLAQVAWLKRELAASRATWKVIAADLPIGVTSYDAAAQVTLKDVADRALWSIELMPSVGVS